MPVYVYKNLQTGETFELQQSIKEPALTVHPETGAPVKRVIQPVGIAFKGSGFYVTDSRKSAPGTPKAEAAKKDESKAETSGAKESGGDAAAKSGGDAKSKTPAPKEGKKA